MALLYEKLYISDSPSNRTFQFDDSLPPLPLPELEQTLTKYLVSVKPFLSEEEFDRTTKLTTDFKNGVGKDLQERLKLHAKDRKNWVKDWWLKYAYLSNRTPLLPNCSMVGPEVKHMDVWVAREEFTIKYTCDTLYMLLSFFELLRKERLRPQFSKYAEKFSMDQFRNMFSTTRVPGESIDELRHYFKPERDGTCPLHIVVFCRGHVWFLNPWTEKETILPHEELAFQLKYIKEQSESETPGPGIASLTLDDRDTWAKNRSWLSSLSAQNKQNLDLIESAICAISFLDFSPSSYGEHCQSLFSADGKNRWADKSYSIYAFNNGYMGAALDHTGCDAMMATIFAHYAHTRFEEEGEFSWEPVDSMVQGLLPYKLEFHVDSLIEEGITSANETFTNLGSETRVIFGSFLEYGKDWIKSVDLHPDSFVQCLLQLAFYKMHNKLAPIYETATTRRYFEGRTETIRSCTPEVAEWIYAMENDEVPMAEKRRKLSVAAKRHVDLMNECQMGKGIDRHLMGLYLVAMEANLPVPEFFTDEAFYKSGGGGNFLLSTSLIGYTENLGGVAAMTKDGYGVFYTLLPDKLFFFITNYREGNTCLRGFLHTLTSSLLRIRDIINSPSSKI